MKIAAIQMVSTQNVAENLQTTLELLQAAAKGGAQLVVLPEHFYALGLPHAYQLQCAENDGDLLHSPIQNTISKAAKDLNLWIVAGSLPLRSQDSAQHVRNSSLVYNAKGEQVARYDKIHLFHFDNGTERYDESKQIEAGTTPQTFEIPEDSREGSPTIKVGMSICYDLRFPELYRQLSAPNTKPCDVMLVPAAFTCPTGQAHWEILLRARAIENQCYILAAAQGGTHPNGRKTWGHSMIIDPWGQILAMQSTGSGVIFADIDRKFIHTVRTQLPALNHRMLVD